MTDHLAFNTAWSFTTNTNWQSYGGESTMSYLSQMLALASHNFFSAAVGIAIAAAVVRGIARHSTKTLGNFWVDLVRINYYLLLPICIVYALFLVAQGVPQNFKPYDTAKVVEVQTVQVPKKDDAGNPVKDAEGESGHGRSKSRFAEHRGRTDRLADGDQDAGNQRWWIYQRERRSSL